MLAINADIEQEEEDDELFGPGLAPPRGNASIRKQGRARNQPDQQGRRPRQGKMDDQNWLLVQQNMALQEAEQKVQQLQKDKDGLELRATALSKKKKEVEEKIVQEMDWRMLAEDRAEKLESELEEMRLEAEQKKATLKKEKEVQEELQRLKLQDE